MLSYENIQVFSGNSYDLLTNRQYLLSELLRQLHLRMRNRLSTLRYPTGNFASRIRSR